MQASWLCAAAETAHTTAGSRKDARSFAHTHTYRPAICLRFPMQRHVLGLRKNADGPACVQLLCLPLTAHTDRPAERTAQFKIAIFRQQAVCGQLESRERHQQHAHA